MKPILSSLLFALAAFAADQPPAGLELMKPGLDVGILVSDAAKSMEFYAQTLGLKHIGTLNMPNGGRMMRFQSGASVLKVIAYEKVPPAGGGPVRAAIGIRLVTVLLADGEGVATRAAAKGQELKWTKGGNFRYTFVNDPDGNVLEVVDLGAGAAPQAMQRAAIGLTVADAEKSRAFYGKLLGLPEQPAQELPTGGTKYSFMAGPTVVKFWQAAANTPKMTGGPQEATGIRYFTFSVKDTDAAAKWLTERGAKIVMPPTDFGKLARIMFVADPDGNFIEFAGPPKPAAAPAK